MNEITHVAIEIYFISSDNKVMVRGTFPLKGRKQEELAYYWWRQVRRGMPYGGQLEKVICDGEDITQLVKELERASRL